ncbi:Two component response regulator [Gammaproteobacteria bacterium]
MSNLNIACCYYPTTVAFIDDNKSFLDNILLEFDENINTCSFTEPTKAVECLKSHVLISFVDKYLKSLKNNEHLEEFDYNNIEHGYVDVDVFSIHKEIYDPNRFSKVVVVVVDYTMPGMNGLELCRVLREFPFKFVLITGDATLGKAVDAFNEGLIHQFIPKNDCDFTHKLQNIIYDLQEKQFEECSDIIVKSLSINKSVGLGDPLLINFLKGFFKKNNIVEYYLINESGCFLMADANGNLSWMVIKSEEEMAEYTSVAIDNYGKEEIIKELQSRGKVLFLHTEEEHTSVTVDNWENYLHSATKLIGENNIYYYSHVKAVGNDIVFPNKITSYEKFLAMK